jgi:hypothetical protein
MTKDTNKQTNKLTNKQTDKQTDRQADRQADSSVPFILNGKENSIDCLAKDIRVVTKVMTELVQPHVPVNIHAVLYLINFC